MRIVAFVLALIALSPWLGLPAPPTKSVSALPAQSGERGPVTADIEDSDLFFQNAIRATGPERDNTQKIDALIKRMTLEEQVGHITHLPTALLAKSRDQEIQIHP